MGIDDQRGVARQDASAGFTPGIFAREQGIAGWRARGGCGVAVGEAQTFTRESINVRRVYSRRAVTTDVAVTEIIGIEEDDVGLVGTRERCDADSEDGQDGLGNRMGKTSNIQRSTSNTQY